MAPQQLLNGTSGCAGLYDRRSWWRARWCSRGARDGVRHQRGAPLARVLKQCRYRRGVYAIEYMESYNSSPLRGPSPPYVALQLGQCSSHVYGSFKTPGPPCHPACTNTRAGGFIPTSTCNSSCAALRICAAVVGQAPRAHSQPTWCTMCGRITSVLLTASSCWWTAPPRLSW